MKLDEFVLENWLNPAANSPKNKVYLGGSCVLPMTVEELFELTGENLDSFLEDLKKDEPWVRLLRRYAETA